MRRRDEVGREWRAFMSATMSKEHAALLREALTVIEDDIRDVGPCEHDVNICVCGLKHLAARIREALGMAQNDFPAAEPPDDAEES